MEIIVISDSNATEFRAHPEPLEWRVAASVSHFVPDPLFQIKRPRRIARIKSWRCFVKLKQWSHVVVFLLFCWLPSPFLSGADQAIPPAEAAKGDHSPYEFVTHHKITIGKDVLSYTTVAGEMILTDTDGNQQASIFTIAYTLDGLSNAADRPITFLFNGGPGCASVFLHLGAFGPRRVAFSDDPVNAGAPPYQLVDNPNTLLRYTDLVFVDPVGTGYSHALGKKKDSDFWGVDEDAESMTDFVRKYLSKNKRWNSPLFLAGESYGTIRASELVKNLELKILDTVTLDGVILLSSGLDVRSFADAGPANELPYVTDIPTFAATAYYHNALPEKPPDFEKFLQDARAFASTEYLTALFAGDTLSDERTLEIAQKLHYFTGLSIEYLKNTRLRIDRDRFLKELLRSRGQTLALHDTRFLGKDPDDAGENVQFDPFMLGTTGPFVIGINSYLSTELNAQMDRPYEVFSLDAFQSWKRAGGNNAAFDGYLYTMPNLTAAASTNKDFRVFVANGIYDLATPFFTTEYVFDHSGIPRDRVTLRNYDGGHMMYIYGPSLQKLCADIGVFIKGK